MTTLNNKVINEFVSYDSNTKQSLNIKTKISQNLFVDIKKILIEDKNTNVEIIWLDTCEQRGWAHRRAVTQIDNFRRTETQTHIRIKGEQPPSTLKTLFSTFKKVGDDILTFENVKDVIKLAQTMRDKKSTLETILKMVNKLSENELQELKETLK